MDLPIYRTSPYLYWIVLPLFVIAPRCGLNLQLASVSSRFQMLAYAPPRKLAVEAAAPLFR